MRTAKFEQYDSLREAFYQSLSLHMVEKTGLLIEARAIGSAALAQTVEWEDRRFQWNWFDLKRRFRNIPARLELSIDVQSVVCGLAIGKPSRGRRHLSVYFFEGNPDKSHPLKRQVLPVLVESSLLYGQALGCAYLRLVNPVSDLHDRYRALGFQFGKESGGRIYCERELVRRPV